MEDYINNIDLQNISLQTLAFIGDAVYNVYIRLYLASNNNLKTGKLHNKSIKYVSAKGQSKIIDKIIDILTEEEINIYKRGRNTNINTISKNVDIIEALIGYLYLTKNNDRLNFLIDLCIKNAD